VTSGAYPLERARGTIIRSKGSQAQISIDDDPRFNRLLEEFLTAVR